MNSERNSVVFSHRWYEPQVSRQLHVRKHGGGLKILLDLEGDPILGHLFSVLESHSDVSNSL